MSRQSRPIAPAPNDSGAQRARQRVFRLATPANLGLLVLVGTPAVALAHQGGATPRDLWSHWEMPWLEALLLLLSGVWYAWGVRSLWQRAGRGRGISIGCVLAFAACSLTLVIALATPLDALAESLFSAHMVQHLLLMLVAAPLWVLGTPVLAFLWALPPLPRRRIGRYWKRSYWLRRTTNILTSGGPALVLSTAVLWFWHLPLPYQSALRNSRIHAVEHLTFFGSASLFWWSVLQPTGRRRTSHAGALLLIVATLMQCGALGALLMFATTPWYPMHAAGAAAWGVSLLEDQQLAGLIMWIPSAAIYVGVAAWLFLCWMESDARLGLSRQAASTAKGVHLASSRGP